MAHQLNVPTRLRFWRVPVVWTLYKSEIETRFTGKVKHGVQATEIDGNHCWKEFFELPEGDDSALFELLNKVGLWEPDPPPAFVHHKADKYIPIEAGGRFFSSYIPAVDPAQVWLFRRTLKATLPNRKQFIEKFAASRRPKELDPLSDAMRDLLYNQFSIRFELDSKEPAAVLSTVSLREMILAINYRDFASGAHYQICQRKDCSQPLFTVAGRRKRKFCSWYCGHLVSVRMKRREGKKRGKKR
jgi:hypothetical protein